MEYDPIPVTEDDMKLSLGLVAALVLVGMSAVADQSVLLVRSSHDMEGAERDWKYTNCHWQIENDVVWPDAFMPESLAMGCLSNVTINGQMHSFIRPKFEYDGHTIASIFGDGYDTAVSNLYFLRAEIDAVTQSASTNAGILFSEAGGQMRFYRVAVQGAVTNVNEQFPARAGAFIGNFKSEEDPALSGVWIEECAVYDTRLVTALGNGSYDPMAGPFVGSMGSGTLTLKNCKVYNCNVRSGAAGGAVGSADFVGDDSGAVVIEATLSGGSAGGFISAVQSTVSYGDIPLGGGPRFVTAITFGDANNGTGTVFGAKLAGEGWLAPNMQYFAVVDLSGAVPCWEAPEEAVYLTTEDIADAYDQSWSPYTYTGDGAGVWDFVNVWRESRGTAFDLGRLPQLRWMTDVRDVETVDFR